MCKKIISTILCMVMLLSVIGVSAATATTTDAMARIVYTDDFDGNTGTPNNKVANAYTSEVLANNSENNTDTSAVTRGKGTWVTVTGVDGESTLAYQSNGSGKAYLRVRQLSFGNASATSGYEFSFDFLVDKTATQTLNLLTQSHNGTVWGLFQLGTDGYVKTHTDGAAFASSGTAYTANTWYNVKAILKGTTIYGWMTSYSDPNFSVYSELTGVTETYISPFYFSASGAKITLDNLELIEYNASTNAPAVVTAPAIAGSNTVSVDTASVDVTMDQALDVTTTATLNGENCAIAVKDIDTYTYTITLPELESGTDYTLSLAGLKNLSGKPATETYSFKTVSVYQAPEVETSNPADGATGISRTVGTISVTFSKALTVAPETVTLSGGGVDIIADVSDPDNGTYTLTWDETLAINVPYTVDLSEFGDGTSFVTDSITFTTANDFIAAADGFEGVVQGTNGGYNNGVDQSGSPLTIQGGKSRLKGYVKSEANGYTGEAINLTTGGTGKYECVLPLQTVNTYARASHANATTGETEYEQLIVTYRINFKNTISSTYGQTVAYSTEAADKTDRGARIRLGAVAGGGAYDRDNALAFVSSDATKTYIDAETYATSARTELDNDRWYNVVYAIDGTEQTFTLIDAVDGSVVWSYKEEYTEARPVHFTAGEALTIYPINLQRHQTADYSLYNSNLSVLLDDFSIWSIKPWENDHALAVISVAEEDGTFAMTFNQPVMGKKNMLAVALNENRNDDIAFNAAFTYPDFCSQTVTLSALPKSADLNLDYSGLKGISGSKIAESVNSLIGFETGIDDEFNAAFVGDATVSGSNVTFNLYGGAATSPKVYVAFYNEGKLVNVVPKDDVTLTAGAKTAVTVAAPEACDTVKVFAWNADLQPQMLNHNQALVIQPAVSE